MGPHDGYISCVFLFWYKIMLLNYHFECGCSYTAIDGYVRLSAELRSFASECCVFEMAWMSQVTVQCL